jgi:hypothetical protein
MMIIFLILFIVSDSLTEAYFLEDTTDQKILNDLIS